MSAAVKAKVLHWFMQEIARHTPLASAVAATWLISSLLSEVAIPYLLAQFLQEWNEDQALPTMPWLLLWSAVFTIASSPVRGYLLRKLEYVGREQLVGEIDKKISKRTNPLKKSRGELNSAIGKFLDTWSNLVIAAGAHGITTVVSFVGMIVLMALKAPFMLFVMVAAMTFAVVFVLTSGKILLRAWGKRTEMTHQESDALDGLIASQETNWLRSIMSHERYKITRKWSVAARSHGGTVFMWQLGANGLVNLMLIGAVVGSVLLANQYRGQLDTLFLSVWFSAMMSNRIQSVFFICEAFGAGLADARVLIEELGEGIHRPPPPSRCVTKLALCGVSTHYQSDDGNPVVVHLPDLAFHKGEPTVLTGENGRGKTTLFRLAVGLLPYQGSVALHTPTGTIEARDFDVRDLSVYSAQSNAVLEKSTVRSLFKHAKSHEVREALEWAGFPLSISPSRRLVDCSGGQRRRAFNAAVFHAARTTRLLLLDEPTNDLSQEGIDQLLAGIDKFLANYPDTVVIIISHERKILTHGFRVVEM